MPTVKRNSRALSIGCAIDSRDIADSSIFAQGGLYAHDECTTLENKTKETDLYVACANGNTTVDLATGVMHRLTLAFHRLKAGATISVGKTWRAFNVGENIASTKVGTVALSGTGNIITTIPLSGLTKDAYYALKLILAAPATITFTGASGHGMQIINNTQVQEPLGLPKGCTTLLVQTTGATGTTPNVVLTCTAGVTSGLTDSNKASYIFLHLVTDWVGGLVNLVF